jgi:acetyltransferase-like isoleucine patch superfamily enzyme
MNSIFLRKIVKKYHGIDVGLFSYGCFDPKRFAPGTTIGRYCSFAPTCYRFNGNHGISYLTTHPFIYNIRFGIVAKESISRTNCIIEDDVWVGHNAIILPSVGNIGRGAIIAAGAVVTKDVPRYAVIAGNPAKVIKYRFNEETIEKIEKTLWWEKNMLEFNDFFEKNREFIYAPQK